MKIFIQCVFIALAIFVVHASANPSSHHKTEMLADTEEIVMVRAQ